MRKLILISKTSKHNTCSYVVRLTVDIFRDPLYTKILSEKYGIDVIINPKLSVINERLRKSKEYDDAILLGVQPHGFHSICNLDQEIIKNRRIKLVGWQNDPHFFARSVVKNKTGLVQNYSDKIYPIPTLEKLDKFMTPSAVYFKNLKIVEYDDKIVDFFYFLNPNYFPQLLEKSYATRKKQILLSGSMAAGYTSRHKFEQLRKSTDDFESIIVKLKHPGYSYEKNAAMTDLNYYNKLSEYKGAFVGHHNFPLNFLLGKHIEVLMCGCLGFYEPNPLLEPQLGLIENVHYISCYKDGKLIQDYNFYKNWIESGEGEKIAKQGQEYVMENFGEKRIHKFFELLNSF